MVTETDLSPKRQKINLLIACFSEFIRKLYFLFLYLLIYAPMVDTNNSGIMQKFFGFLRKFGADTDAAGDHLLYEGYIAGYQYHQGPKFERDFEPGTSFSLVHEPENPFDDHAVAVYYHNNRIGFIPNGWSREVADKLHKGHNLAARVAKFDPELDPWQRLQVEVVYRQEEKG